ncbi:hypothetical protein HMPREF1871_00914 [Gemelliphila asaccharolytica]|uniref:Uncharacterized protein n=1 Tax=Gemelliphila asaccharolytica TaxID=502393 RepID=A0ABR5TKV8_9BACL|nr:hypothetical protein HMPREF1871_00914 [Gemella asaccharolytica]
MAKGSPLFSLYAMHSLASLHPFIFYCSSLRISLHFLHFN